MGAKRVIPGSVAVVLAVLAGLFPGFQALAGPLPDDFVYLRDIDPSILQDIRYASSNNFVGRPLAGYDAAECIVRRDVGLRLKSIQSELKQRDLSLKMLDCYRPARAVADILAWSQDGRDTAVSRRFSPAHPKRDLFRLGYVARRSAHSTGAALDLTLVDLKADKGGDFDPAASYGDCTAPAARRAPEGSVDMGTGYDCLDGKSHAGSGALTPDQRWWRRLLVTAMAQQGFVNYAREWWHFSLPGANGKTYDFPITPRS